MMSSSQLAWRERHRHQEYGLSKTEAHNLARGLIKQMSKAFEGSLVDGWDRLDGSFGLPDPNDEHVVATAVTAHAP